MGFRINVRKALRQRPDLKTRAGGPAVLTNPTTGAVTPTPAVANREKN